MHPTLKKVLAVIALGTLTAVVVGASAFLALRLYSGAQVHRLLAQALRLQGLSRDLQDEVGAIGRADFSALAALRRDDARIDRLMADWREAYGRTWRPAALVIPVRQVRALSVRWPAIHGQVADLLARKQALTGLGRAIDTLDKTAATLLDQSEKVVADMVQAGADERDVYLASRQIVLIQRISEHLHALLRPAARHADVAESSDYQSLVHDSARFEHTLEGMLKKGDRRMNIDAGPEVQQRLRDNGKLFVSINRDIGRLLSMVPVLQDMRRTIVELRTSSRGFSDDAAVLFRTLVTYRARHDAVFAAVYLVAAAALLALFAYVLYGQRRFRGRLEFSVVQNDRLRRALSELQPALAALAKGRLPAGELEAGAGVEGVIVPFNQAMTQWRDTLTAVKGWTDKLGPLVEQINAAAGKVSEGAARQIEGTTVSSAGLNRALATAEHASDRVAETSRSLEMLKTDAAVARNRVTDAVRQGQDQPGRERLEALDARLNALAQGVEELSVMVLHLLVRIQDAGQGGHEPVSYANRALQVAHQCTEAVEALDQGLTQLREGEQPGAEPNEAMLRQMDEHFAAVDSQSDRIAGLLQETAPLLAELTAALLSVSDELDNIHEYTMHASDETADVSKAGNRIAELVDHIGRSLDKYNIVR